MFAEEKGSKWPEPESSCSRVMTIGSRKLSLVNWRCRSLVYPQAGRRLHLIRRRVGGDDLVMVSNSSMELIRHAVYPISFRSMEYLLSLEHGFCKFLECGGLDVWGILDALMY